MWMEFLEIMVLLLVPLLGGGNPLEMPILAKQWTDFYFLLYTFWFLAMPHSLWDLSSPTRD